MVHVCLGMSLLNLEFHVWIVALENNGSKQDVRLTPLLTLLWRGVDYAVRTILIEGN